MKIVLQNLGKKFIRQWIFRGIDFTVRKGEPVAITGPNGSGKSTLLRILSGWMIPTKGKVALHAGNSPVPDDELYKYVDYVAPYTELIEELTLQELIEFHFNFKTMRSGFNSLKIMDLISMRKEKDKQVRNFSSGMKQRLKLGLSFFSESPVLLLDEPASNLDEPNKAWYLEQMKDIIDSKIIIVASNQQEEYPYALQNIHIPDYTFN